jgi:hypothetical protein
MWRVIIAHLFGVIHKNAPVNVVTIKWCAHISTPVLTLVNYLQWEPAGGHTCSELRSVRPTRT